MKHNPNHYCPYCGTKLPLYTCKARAYETEITGQTKITCVRECPRGCMHQEAIRKGLIAS